MQVGLILTNVVRPVPNEIDRSRLRWVCPYYPAYPDNFSGWSPLLWDGALQARVYIQTLLCLVKVRKVEQMLQDLLHASHVNTDISVIHVFVYI